jgi:hypothetical protein
MHVADEITVSAATPAGVDPDVRHGAGTHGADQVVGHSVGGGVSEGTDTGDWAEQTRRVLTRDLLVRAAYAPRGEARALEFRALHLNLPLVGEVAERLGLTDRELRAAEHDAIHGLLEAVHAFDPYGEQEFADVAASYLAASLRPHAAAPAPLPHRRPVRLAIHRMALAITGHRA